VTTPAICKVIGSVAAERPGTVVAAVTIVSRSNVVLSRHDMADLSPLLRARLNGVTVIAVNTSGRGVVRMTKSHTEHVS